jgi:hypothetical protein
MRPRPPRLAIRILTPSICKWEGLQAPGRWSNSSSRGYSASSYITRRLVKNPGRPHSATMRVYGLFINVAAKIDAMGASAEVAFHERQVPEPVREHFKLLMKHYRDASARRNEIVHGTVIHYGTGTGFDGAFLSPPMHSTRRTTRGGATGPEVRCIDTPARILHRSRSAFGVWRCGLAILRVLRTEVRLRRGASLWLTSRRIHDRRRRGSVIRSPCYAKGSTVIANLLARTSTPLLIQTGVTLPPRVYTRDGYQVTEVGFRFSDSVQPDDILFKVEGVPAQTARHSLHLF